MNGLSRRQQRGKPACLADYIASADDYLGLFWVTAGIGLDELVDAYEAQGDTYSALIAKAWADRFAESLESGSIRGPDHVLGLCRGRDAERRRTPR